MGGSVSAGATVEQVSAWYTADLAKAGDVNADGVYNVEEAMAFMQARDAAQVNGAKPDASQAQKMLDELHKSVNTEPASKSAAVG